ncbi:hypothetical protein CRUP_005898 [Coryphaenoides rupestris]|nr:hypothetical protein CRUP_005898 [Coryphaenoides rupestris]
MNLCVCWFLALVLWPLGATRMEIISSDLDFCYEDDPTRQRYNRTSSGEMQLIVDEEEDVEVDVEEVSCFLYPERLLRCTIPSRNLNRGSQLSAVVNISDKEGKTTALPECSLETVGPSEEPPGGTVCVVECRVDFIFSSLMVHLKVSELDTRTLYCQNLSFEMLEVLSPPPNISVKEMEGFLQVRWGIPYSSSTEANCFHYELEVNQQVSVIEGRNSEQVPLPGPCLVRMRTRVSPNCLGSTEWSTWSHAIATGGTETQDKDARHAPQTTPTVARPRFPPVAPPVCEEEVMVVEDNQP